MRLRRWDVVALGLTLGYVANQLWFLRDWRATPRTKLPGAESPRADWTVVVAARNEAAHVGTLVAEAVAQAREVIVVDDHSDDQTAVRARAAGARVIELPTAQTGKRAALARGIAAARGAWIATVDADVRVPARWLAHLRSAAAPDTVAVAGPVHLDPAVTWFARWQALDFAGMMAVTAASLRGGRFAMGNGANLAFRREAFEAVGGYAVEPGRRESASGDDMLLLAKLVARYPGRVAFAKSRGAAVATPPQPSLAGFVRQRWRWAAKTGLNRQPALTATLACAWAYHVGLLSGVPLAKAGQLKWGTLAVAWAAKGVVDYALLRSATGFFGRRGLLDATYPAQSLAHAAYVAGVGTLALLPLDFAWKGRRWRV